MSSSGRTILAVLALGALGLGAWQLRSLPRLRAANPTAAVATPSPPPAPARILAEGRLETYPGARVTVSSEVSGVVTNVLVQEKSLVQAGELLLEIKADDIYASLMEARARMDEISSEIRLAKSELRRAQTLAQREVITPQELERHREGLDNLEARYTTASVTVKRLEITSAKTKVSAPMPGTVLTRYVHSGEVVAGGTPLFALADLTRTRIEAEVDEYDSGRLRLGAQVSVRAEGYSEVWTGRVEEIPDSVGPRSLHPRDPAQPSDVRVVLVKVALQEPTPLKLGQRVEVEIRCDEPPPAQP